MASTHRDRVRKCPISVVFFSLVGLQVLWVIFSIQGIERPAEPSCGSGSSGPCEPRKPQMFDHNQKLNGTWRELSQPRVLYNGEDDRMRRNMNFPWWICYELCKQTVYYVPSGTFVEQLHVLAILLKLSRERGFAVKYVHAPDRGSPAWDQIFELPLMDIETCVRKGSKQTDVVQSNNCLISRREEISGTPEGSERLDIPEGQIDCELQSEVDWDYGVTWKKLGESGKRFACVQTSRIVVEELREPSKSSIKWFFTALKPTIGIRKYIVAFRNNYQWLSYTWTGVQINAQSLGQGPTEHDTIDGYTRQMHQLFKSIPNHDLEEWQLVHPMRFFLATNDREAREKVLDSFHPGVTVYQGKVMPESHTSFSEAARDVIDLYLLASCKIVLGNPNSLTSRTASLIGDSLYLEPAVAGP